MKIALLSDTHGHRQRTLKIGRLLWAESPGMVIHCGDLGSEAVLFDLIEIFSPVSIPIYAVLGNVDLWDEALLHFPEHCGAQVAPHLTIKSEGQQLGVAHGHDHRQFEAMVASGEYDYVFTGHTHERADRVQGRTRIINPGAVYRSAEPGAALLDTASGVLRFLDLTL